MEQKTLHAFESKCTQEDPPACQTMCPLHVEVRAFTDLMARGRFDDARKILERAMPVPELMGFLCDGVCMPHCRRAEVDGAVNMPLLERFCVSRTEAPKSMPMPGSGKAVAVAGAGLSSFSLAWELAKKGHSVTIFHPGPVGGRLLGLPYGILPEGALEQALSRLKAMRVAFEPVDSFSPEWRGSMLESHLALYLGLDDNGVKPEAFGLQGIKDFLTQETEHPGIFAGGLTGGGATFVPASAGAFAPSFVREAADGKRAASSIIRLMQGVAPGTAREHDGVYASGLFTNLSNVAPAPPVIPEYPNSPTEEEALAESARCIQCECLECVKNCVYLARYKGYPKRYAREIYNNLSVVHGLRRTNTQINSCAECGLCAAICPNGADMGAFCADARKEMVRSRRMPPSAHEFALEDMEFSNSPDIAFFRHQPGMASSAWAFFPGCQLPASLPERTKAAYAYLCGQLEGGVGLFFRCCGAPARWSGREGLTGQTAKALRAVWKEAGEPTLLLACSSCFIFFSAELPDIPVLSLWDVLADLPLPEGARPFPAPLALHDPCAARKSPISRRSVRKQLESLGQDVEELALGRELTRCCGYGGLASAADPVMGEAYAASRAEDTDKAILAYCIMCRDRIRKTGKPTLHVFDLLFADTPEKSREKAVKQDTSLESSAIRPAPGISDRQRDRALFRADLLHSLWAEDPPGKKPMDAIRLRIDDALEKKLEARRILLTDIKRVIAQAEESGAQFHNPGAGRFLTSLRPRQVTFWVEYSKEEDGSYRIHDAYCHRMVVPGTPGEGLPTAATLEGCAPKGGRM